MTPPGSIWCYPAGQDKSTAECGVRDPRAMEGELLPMMKIECSCLVRTWNVRWIDREMKLCLELCSRKTEQVAGRYLWPAASRSLRQKRARLSLKPVLCWSVYFGPWGIITCTVSIYGVASLTKSGCRDRCFLRSVRDGGLSESPSACSSCFSE